MFLLILNLKLSFCFLFHDLFYSIHNAIVNGKNGTYNIVSGKVIAIKDLAELMILLSGRKLEIKNYNTKKRDIRYSQADISHAEKDLRYSPKFELDKIKELLE